MDKRAICTCLLIILVTLGGISIFIAWLNDRIKLPTFTVDGAAISGYNFSDNDLLNGFFVLAIRSHNRDPKYSIKYDTVVVSVYHDGFFLAYDDLGGPFMQPHGNDVTFTGRPMARNISVHEPEVAAELRRETGRGELGLEVMLRAIMRFEVKGWKHSQYILKANCSPIVFDLTSGYAKRLDRVICN